MELTDHNTIRNDLEGMVECARDEAVLKLLNLTQPPCFTTGFFEIFSERAFRGTGFCRLEGHGLLTKVGKSSFRDADKSPK